MKKASAVYRLLGDEARLRLLRLLGLERLNVTELTGILGGHQACPAPALRRPPASWSRRGRRVHLLPPVGTQEERADTLWLALQAHPSNRLTMRGQGGWGTAARGAAPAQGTSRATPPTPGQAPTGARARLGCLVPCARPAAAGAPRGRPGLRRGYLTIEASVGPRPSSPSIGRSCRARPRPGATAAGRERRLAARHLESLPSTTPRLMSDVAASTPRSARRRRSGADHRPAGACWS